MSAPLRVLLVEDMDADAALLTRHLEREGYLATVHRVDTPEGFRDALSEPLDVILADDSLPRFSAPEALKLLQEAGLDLPFIIVSGSIGEERAVAALKAGAHDYVDKNRLARLGPAIERERREAAVRATNRQGSVERDKLTVQLQLADRLASVGTLAAGVAHEINNPLGYVITNLELCLDAVERGAAVESLQEPLRQAREGAERVRTVVRDLKTFSRADDDSRSLVRLKAVAESALNIARNELHHRATVVLELEEAPRVDANEARLGQVVLNLLINAAQAVPPGAPSRNQVTIATGTAPDGRAFLFVRDTGVGIPKHLLGRIFDPFFTTKGPGEGTGLGLSICHTLVSALGGELRVQSEEGAGSTFTVLLPTAAPRRASTAPVLLTVPEVRRGRVLLVDDEPHFASSLCKILATRHDAEAVGSAAEALSRILAGPPYDAVLCDLMMPNMSGMELHAVLTARAPEQASRMIFLTGGAFTAQARAFLDQVPNPRLEKPVDPPAVAALVARLVLRGPPVPSSER